VLGIERADGTFLVGPTGETMLSVGDRLMLYGAAEELEALVADRGRLTVRG
jgi:Trk K+ transport system NAD-binding subunit